jgi:hypothetical protein
MHTYAGAPPAVNRRLKKTATMNSATLGTAALRVDFQRCGDRYAHQISHHLSDGTGGLMISQEGSSEDAWPPSPALQSLHLETRPDGTKTAMLVGMAGRSHWSMSVEADVQQNRLLFDVACRVHEPPGWLGSTYNMCAGGKNLPLDRLALAAWHGGQAGEEIAVQIDRLSGSVRISAPQAAGTFPHTIRWRYVIGIRE